jgi:hypothetical protein
MTFKEIALKHKYSIVAYLWTFIASTDYLPELMESLASVKDLNVRFSTDEKV